MAEEFQTALFRLIQPLHFAHSFVHGLRVQHVLLLEKVEIRMRLPQRVGEASIRRCVIGGRCKIAFAERLLGIHIVLKRFAPISDLLFDDFRRILYHFLKRDLTGLGVKLRRRALQILRHLTLVRHGSHQSLRKLLNTLHVFF